MMVEMFNPTEKLELLAASASEIHAAAEHGKMRVEFKSDEDRTRKRQLRLLKNRQSAALSRQRKKEYISDLEERTNELITENHTLVQKIAKLSSMNLEFKMHIDSLEKSLNETKNENMDLRSRLPPTTDTSPTTSVIPSPSPSLPSLPSPSTTTTTTSTITTTTTTTTSTTSPKATHLKTEEALTLQIQPLQLQQNLSVSSS